MDWSQKQKRCYHRLLSGIYFHKGEKMRFLTLTTAKDMKRSLEKSFNILRNRLVRVRPIDFLFDGYIEHEWLSYYYPDESLWFEPLSRFHFVKVKTSEGVSGVFHILYFGSYYPKRWLVDMWNDITGTAYIVDIRETDDVVDNAEGLAGYCIEQYTAGQSEFVSFSTSKDWCFKGYIDVWNNLKRAYTYKLDEPVQMKNFVLYKWTDTAACIEGFKSYIDEAAGRGIGQRCLDEY